MYLGKDDAPALADGGWPPVPMVPEIDAVTARVPAAGPASERAPRQLLDPVTHVAYRGVDVLTRTKSGSGLVNLAVLVPRQREAETADNAGISSLLLRSALRGAGGLDATQLAEAAERLGGSLSTAMLAGGIGWSITVRREAVDEAAALLHLVASGPTLADEAVERERDLQVSDARQAEDDMFNYPIRRVLDLAFPASAHGLPVLGAPDAVGKLTTEDVRRWGQEVHGRRLVAVAVGDADPEALTAGLDPIAAWTGTAEWRGASPPLEVVPVRDSQEREKAQSALAMAFPAPPRGSADRYPMLVLGALLSGLAGRLFEELREKRSLAYTVSAMPWQRHDAGCFLAYIATAPEREEEAREAMLAELRSVASVPWAEGELDRARRYVAGSLQVRQQRAGAVAAEIYEGWNFGDLEPAEATVARLRAVTEDEVRRVAERVFGAACAEFVVRGTGAVVR